MPRKLGRSPIFESARQFDLDYLKSRRAEIVEQLFNFTDKGEREVALRPELTPTLARVVAAHEREFKKPLKWFSIGQFFRYEKQQRGRLREHFQLNCDIIGEKDLAADIELWAPRTKEAGIERQWRPSPSHAIQLQRPPCARLSLFMIRSRDVRLCDESVS
jgi:phenylalanyl-tRNA synthetase alpha subunit